jgi:hypothetical protein
MAEFKLGRIRFIWKGTWTTSTVYVKDDVVRQGGKLFLCVTGHTAAADFSTDLASGNWQLTADGLAWAGAWATSTYYKLNDLVKYGGVVYLCNTTHTSASTSALGLENDFSKWTVFANSFNWVGNWNTSTRYKAKDVVKYGAETYVCKTGHTSAATTTLGLENDQSSWDVFSDGLLWTVDWTTSTKYRVNDVVRYGGILYICNLAHTSAGTATLGLENDQSKWDYLHKGFNYIGAWSGSSVRYKANDVVKYGADLWICTTNHTSSATFSTSNFTKFIEGLQYFNTWSSSTTYQNGDLVTYGGFVYIATSVNTNITPSTDGGSNWALFTSGFTYIGAWSSATAYQVGNVVTVGGYTYVATADGTNQNPATASAYWSRLNSGFRWLATAQTFTGVTTTNVTGSGNGAQFTVATSGTNYTVTKTANGTGYSATAGSNTIKILGTSVGGTTPFNDITITITGVSTGAISTFTYTGIATTWASGTAYVLGDTVFYGPSTYVCILGHTSASGNSPANDSTGTYWNLMAQGTSTSVLTTQGDMVYYGGAGPTRLPIGTAGQVLTVSASGLPNWTYWGVVNQVYYVSTSTGTNSPAPAFGTSVDKPWQSIRYATYQIEQGAQFPAATNLLTRNRSYIQAEVIAWINAQIALNTGIWASFTYNTTKCSRDIGFVVDALAYDLSHGGNQKTVAAAQAYVNALTGSNPTTTGTYTLLSGQYLQDVASYNQVLAVILRIIQNLAPTTTYQSSVTRISDATQVSETGASTLLTNLMGVITSALTAQSSTNIPAVVIPNYTINTKTGTYYEVLPIIIPQNTSVVGDELRSTNIQPAPAGTAYQYDVAATVATMTRLSGIMSNLLTNATVTPSTGNSVAQVTTRPASNSTVVTQVQGLFTNLNAYVNYYVNSTGSAPTLTGTNTQTQTQANYDAVAILTENLAFLKAEAIAYINSTYTSTVTATASGTNITVGSSANFAVNMRVVFSGTTFGGIVAGTIYYVTQIVNGTTITVSLQQGGSPASWTSASGTCTVTMYYPTALCQRDVEFTIKAIQYDIVYTGNYKTLQAAQLYTNAVLGSLTQNMFLVRNGTGLRNCTLQGLTGTLSSANSYGTKRPTAGAYVSLDPGWGPADSRVWINSRSPYPQNVTMFGTGCVGMKVDGTLHNGGNRSIVANDFTTVLSDGIGSWIYGPNALAELVSVFSYYAYSGYLAEAGGKIRATNGNSSYGTYGVLAEGVDSTESPLTVQINNRYNQALITNTLTDGVNNIWRFEYLNAGSNYNTASYSISGAGYGAVTVGNEFRDNAVFETRVFSPGTTYASVANAGQSGTSTSMTIAATDQAISNAYLGMRIIVTAGTGAGQTGYIVGYNAGSKLANVAKESVATITATQTINSTFSSSGFINGTLLSMPTVTGTPAAGAVLGGLGVTANTYITSVNSASFTGAIAQGTAVTFTGSISGTTLTVTSTPTGAGLVVGQVLSGGTIPAGAYITGLLTGTGTSSSSTWTINTTVTQTSTTITATPTVLTASAVTGAISVGMVVSGLGVGSGTVITALGTGTSGAGTYYVTPAQSASSIAMTGISYNLNISQTVGNYNSLVTITGAQNGIVVPSTGSLYSGMPLYMTGTTIGGLFTAQLYYVLPQGLLSTQFSVATTPGGNPVTVSNQTASTMIINAAGWDHAVPGTAIVNSMDTTSTYIIEPRVVYASPGFTPSAVTQQSGSWIDAAYTDIVATYSSIAASGGAGSAATFTVARTGNAYSVTLASAGSGYAIGNTLTIAGTSLGGTSANNITVTVTNIGSTPSAGTITNFTYTGTGAGGVYVAIPSSGTATQYSFNGSTWTAGGALPSSQSWTAVAAGNGAWIAVATGTNVNAVSTNGTTWTGGGNLPASSTWSAVGYGNGVWQAVATGTTNVAYSSNNGTSWTLSSGGLPTSAPWCGVAYGNGIWVAIAGNTTASSQAAYSTNGTSWVSATLPSSQLWTSVAYGRGRFVAVAETGNIVAYSLNGTTWTQSVSGLPVTQTWGKVRYGQGLFLATGFSLAPTISATTAGSNLVTLSSTVGLSVGETLVPSAVTQTPGVTGTVVSTPAVMNTSSISGTTLTVGSVGSGTITVGMVLTGTGVVAGTYIVSGGGLSWVVSISQSVSSTTITGTNSVVTVSSTSGVAVGQSFIPTAVTQTGTISTTSSAGVSIQLNNSTGISLGSPIVFNVGTTYTPTLTATAAGTNLATLSSPTGILQGQSVVFGTATQTPTLLATSSTGNLLYLSSGTGLVVNESVVFTATTQTPTLLFASGANNLLQLSSTAGLAVGEPIVFTAVTQTPSAATATTNATASMTGSSINGSGVLTVGTLASGTISVGMALSGTGVVTPQAITITGATGTGTSAILTFSAQGSTPFVIGQTIVVSGVVPAGYNGTFVVTGASTSSVTYANNTTGSLTQQGLVTSPLTYITANISGSGTGSTWQTSVNFAVSSTTITGTQNAITLGSTTGMVVGEPIVFSGTGFGGISSGTTYYITEIISATQLSISGAYAGANTTLSTATGSMTVVAGGSFGGLNSGSTYYITGIQGSNVTVSTSFGGSNASVSNAAGAWTSSAGASMGTGVTSGTTYYIQATNSATASMLTSSISGYVLTVGTVGSGTITVGMVLTGTGVVTGTYITQNISGSGAGSTWYVSTSQTVASTTITGTASTITVGLAPSSGAITQSNAAGYWTGVAGTVFGGLTSGQTYYIASVSGSNVTLSTSASLTPVVSLANGAGAWTSLVGASLGGLQAGYPYYVLTNNTGTNQIVVATSYNGSPFTVTNGVGSWTFTAGGQWNQASVTGFISNGVGPTGLGTGGAIGNVLTPTTAVTGTLATGMIVSGTGVYPNASTISTINTGSVVSGTFTTPVLSTTGTVSSITGTGPWTATLTVANTSGYMVGMTITATTSTVAGTTGSLYQGEPTSVVVTSITSGTVLTYTVTGGQTPVAGIVANVSTVYLNAGATSSGLSAGQQLSGTASAVVPVGTYIVGQTTNTNTILATATFFGYTGSNVLTVSGFTTGTINSISIGNHLVNGTNSGLLAGVTITAINISASTVTISSPLVGNLNASLNVQAVSGPGLYALYAPMTAQPFGSIATPTFSNITAGGGTVAVSAISGAGTSASPWVATLTGGSAFDLRYVQVGSWIQATSGTGAIFGGSPSVVTVTAITSNTVITIQVYNNTGGTGTTPVAGNVSACVVPTLTTQSGTTGLANAEYLYGGSVTYGSYIVTQSTSTVATVAAATGTGTTGTNTITLSTFTTGTIASVVVGQIISDGTGAVIQGGSLVTGINGSIITISKNLIGALSGAVTLTTAGAQGTYALNQVTSGTPTNAYVPATESVSGVPTTAISYTVSGLPVQTASTTITAYATSGAYNLAGLVSGATYYVLTIPTSGQVTLGSAYGSSPLALTTSVASWTSVFGSVFGGLQSGTTYYIASINSNQVTLSTSSTLVPVATLSTQGGSWNSTAGQTATAATSEDGITWTKQTLTTSNTWPFSVFGNPGGNPLWVAFTTGSTTANSIVTGPTAQGRVKIAGGLITEWRIVEPGSGYTTTPVVSVVDPNQSATSPTSIIASVVIADLVGTLTVTAGTYYVGQAIVVTGTFTGGSIGSYSTGTTYYVGKVNSSTSIQITDTYANATAASPVFALTTTTGTATPGATFTTNFIVRRGTGVLANPTFTNRGTSYATVSNVSVTGNGYSDLYQLGSYINVSGIYTTPTPGSNITFAGDPNYYKLVAITNILPTGGSGLAPYTAQFQINPSFTAAGSTPAPAHNATATLRLKYSQVRLTGHDFLNVGTGNQVSTNYPNTPAIAADSTKQTVAFGGGRTFFTSTDQDGNFNVGNLFTVVQSTGVATLNANAFNLAGLQSLQLGSVAVGSGSATITQFSTDPYFTANSDNIVPTQKAIKSYISSQIGGGGSTLNVNTLTAGVIYISGNSISTTTGVQITVNNKMYFVGGIDGVPLAMNFLLS